MPEKEKEPQGQNAVEDDPLAELLFEEEAEDDTSAPKEEILQEETPQELEEGEPSQEISEEAESEKSKNNEDLLKEAASEEAQKEVGTSSGSQDEEGGEKSPSEVEEGDDPLASILGEDELAPEEEEEEPVEEEGQEEPSEETEEPAPKKGVLSFIFTVLAILVPLLLFGSGLATLWYLYQNPPFLNSTAEAEPEIKSSPSPSPDLKKTAAPLAVSPIAVEDRKILFLRNFLIPYRRETGEFVFVKAKILLYYANSKEYEIAKQNETLLREEIYRLFKNAPLYVWETKRGAEVLRREIMEYLTKKKIGGVVPVDLQVTGYILK